MSNKAPTEYYPNKVKAQIEALGLMFDEPAYQRTIAKFRVLNITQKQHDVLILHHAQEVYTLFDPKGKGLRFRLLMAAHFLGVTGLLSAILCHAQAILNRIKIALRIA